MSYSHKLLVPAVLALGVFGAGVALVGFDDAKAGSHHNHGMGTQGNTGGGMAAGGAGEGKQGGGNGGGKQGGGNEDGHHGGGYGGHGHFKFGGNTNYNFNFNGSYDNSFATTYSGGGATSDESHRITCIINGQVVPVRSWSECRYGRGFAINGDSYFGGYVNSYAGYQYSRAYRQRCAKVSRQAYQGFMGGGYDAGYGYAGSTQGGYGYAGGYDAGYGYAGGYGAGYGYAGGYAGGHGYAGGYGLGGGQFVGSTAAVMQAERRARGQFSYSAYGSGYGYVGGYGMSGGYGFDGGYAAGYGAGYGFAGGNGGFMTMRHHRARHMHMMGMGQHFGGHGYNTGFSRSMHYGYGKGGGY